MTLLFLDPSTRTGWALCEPSRAFPRIRCGSWKLPEGINAERAAALAWLVTECIRSEGVTRIGVEEPMSAPPKKQKRIVKTPLGFETEETASQGNILTQNLLWSLHGAIAAAAGLERVPLHVVGMKTWRAHTLGKGNGNIKGPESKRRCKALLESIGVHVANQDAAEAGGGLIWLNGQNFDEKEKLLRPAAA